MNCPICLTELKNGTCPECGYRDSSYQEPVYSPEYDDFDTPIAFGRPSDEGEYNISRGLKISFIALLILFAAIVVFIGFYASQIKAAFSSFDLPLLDIRLPEFSVSLPQPPQKKPASSESTAPAVPGLPGTEADEPKELAYYVNAPVQGQKVQYEQPTPQLLWQDRGISVDSPVFTWESIYDQGSRHKQDHLVANVFICNNSGQTVTVSVDSALINGQTVGCSGELTFYVGDRDIFCVYFDSKFLERSGIEEICTLTLFADFSLQADSKRDPIETFSVPLTFDIKAGEVPPPQPLAEPVFWGNDTFALYYAGFTFADLFDLTFDYPVFWVWAENNSDTAIRLQLTSLTVGDRKTTCLSPAGTLIQPHSRSLLALSNPSDICWYKGTVGSEKTVTLQFDLNTAEGTSLIEGAAASIRLL